MEVDDYGEDGVGVVARDGGGQDLRREREGEDADNLIYISVVCTSI